MSNPSYKSIFVIIQDNVEYPPACVCEKAYETREQAERAAWRQLKSDYPNVPVLPTFDADKLESFGECLVKDELSHYNGLAGGADVRYTVDCVKVNRSLFK